MSSGHHTAVFRIVIEGEPLSADLEQLLERAIVDDGLSRPDFVQLVFRDPARDVVSRLGAVIGSTVGVDVVTDDEPQGVRLADAEVIALEADLDPTGMRTIVRAADRSHRLRNGRTTATYRHVTLAEVVEQVAKRRGLEVGRVDIGGAVHEHITQANETDWAFLRSLTAQAGGDIVVAEGRLEVHRAAPSEDGPAIGSIGSADPLELVAGEDLLRLRSSVSASEQVAEVVVRGWDPASKSAITARADAHTTTATLDLTPVDMAEAFHARTHLVAGAPYRTQEQADHAACAIADGVAATSAELDGVARGNVELHAGRVVSIGLLGAPFDGQYTLTSSSHRFDPFDGYTTAFRVSGRRERPALPGQRHHHTGSGPPTATGVAVGLVTAVDDPEGLARVKVSYPWLADDHETDWTRTVQPGAGPGRGMVILPEVGDEVLLGFESGDVQRPFVLGGLYNGVDTPDLGDEIVDGSTGEIRRRGFLSRNGHGIVFLDAADADGIAMMTGDRSLRVSMNATDGVLRLTSDRDLEITAGGRLRIEGATVEIAGQPIKLN